MKKYLILMSFAMILSGSLLHAMDDTEVQSPLHVRLAHGANLREERQAYSAREQIRSAFRPRTLQHVITLLRWHHSADKFESLGSLFPTAFTKINSLQSTFANINADLPEMNNQFQLMAAHDPKKEELAEMIRLGVKTCELFEMAYANEKARLKTNVIDPWIPVFNAAFKPIDDIQAMIDSRPMNGVSQLKTVRNAKIHEFIIQ